MQEAWQADAQVNAIAPRELSHGEPIQYPGDGASQQTGCSMITPRKTRPSIYMPRWVSQILLEITDVRVERLQDISRERYMRRGQTSRLLTISNVRGTFNCRGFGNPLPETGTANPWVWVVESKRVTPCPYRTMKISSLPSVIAMPYLSLPGTARELSRPGHK